MPQSIIRIRQRQRKSGFARKRRVNHDAYRSSKKLNGTTYHNMNNNPPDKWPYFNIVFIGVTVIAIALI